MFKFAPGDVIDIFGPAESGKSEFAEMLSNWTSMNVHIYEDGEDFTENTLTITKIREMCSKEGIHVFVSVHSLPICAQYTIQTRRNEPPLINANGRQTLFSTWDEDEDG